MFLLRLACLVGLIAHTAHAFYPGQFESEVWVPHTQQVQQDTKVKFVVALELHDVEHMHKTLLDVSNPLSKNYGQYLTLDQISARYGPSQADRQAVLQYFQSIEGAKVHENQGEMFEVTAPVASIHEAFGTELGWVSHIRDKTEKKSLRAMKPLTVPEHLHPLISFISLNVPVNHAIPSAAEARSLSRMTDRKEGGVNLDRSKDSTLDVVPESAAGAVAISQGNREAILIFKPYCGLNAVQTNQENPPCASSSAADTPTFVVEVSTHANIQGNTYLLNQEPTVYTIPASKVYCSRTGTPQCVCRAKISNLPKYTQLRANISATYDGETQTQPLGWSNLFALADIATPRFLSELYHIPNGLSAKHGSNQSVAAFYGDAFNNDDIKAFMAMTGLPSASIPAKNVYGDLANDEDNASPSASMNVEYMMALAPNASTYYYSMSDLNPADESNEGFLAYLNLVGGQSNPPLVHVFNYVDDASIIFNTSAKATVQYGQRCDQEFMKAGLRGLSMIFTSGSDGIGGSRIEYDPDSACVAAMPVWPGGSPYVTSVGATQLTDKYLPVCDTPYFTSFSLNPVENRINIECSGLGETVCSATFGGSITSGGGFSTVSDRDKTAPWQSAAVDKYLSTDNSAAYPPLSYFHSSGRGYPDVSAFGTDFIVLWGGERIRVEGGSTLVIAAMVTLWNDMRLAYGMPPMGFVAPFLYHAHSVAPEAFNDVTTGNNACGYGFSIETVDCCEDSFHASPGWDAATGLGSPNFNILANLVLNNQSAFPNQGAFPTGGAQSEYSSDDDNYATESIGISALVIAAVAFVLGAVAMGMVGSLYVGRRFGNKDGKASASVQPTLMSAVP